MWLTHPGDDRCLLNKNTPMKLRLLGDTSKSSTKCECRKIHTPVVYYLYVKLKVIAKVQQVKPKRVPNKKKFRLLFPPPA